MVEGGQRNGLLVVRLSKPKLTPRNLCLSQMYVDFGSQASPEKGLGLAKIQLPGLQISFRNFHQPRCLECCEISLSDVTYDFGFHRAELVLKISQLPRAGARLMFGATKVQDIVRGVDRDRHVIGLG